MGKRLIGRVFNDVVTWNNNRHYVNHRVFLGSIKFIFINRLLLEPYFWGRPSYDTTRRVPYHDVIKTNNRSSGAAIVFNYCY